MSAVPVPLRSTAAHPAAEVLSRNIEAKTAGTGYRRRAGRW